MASLQAIDVSGFMARWAKLRYEADHAILPVRMLKANQWMGKALAPYYHKMLPLMNLFKHRHDLKIMVPPPRCTPATGTRTGERCCW